MVGVQPRFSNSKYVEGFGRHGGVNEVHFRKNVINVSSKERWECPRSELESRVGLIAVKDEKYFRRAAKYR